MPIPLFTFEATGGVGRGFASGFAGLQEWSGWWDLHAPRRIFDPRPVAAATALAGELIQEFPASASFVEAFPPDGLRPGQELLLVD